MKYKLSDICEYRKDKIAVSHLNNTTYISTENMLPNKLGITEASSLPTTNNTQSFVKGDVLVSNIRPYFKKIWYAKFDGGCSNDVLVFKSKKNIDNVFLYYVLSSDSFFDYSMATSKGTKMPRGDKTALMDYEVPNIDLNSQKKIASVLSAIDDKIELNNQINNNLEQQASLVVTQYCDSISSLVKLGEVMSFENGFAFQSKTYLDSGKYKIITIKNVQDGKIDSQGSSFIDEIPSRMKVGCFLRVGDVLLSLTGNVGRVGIVCEDDLLLNQRVAKFEPNDTDILPLLYFYFRLSSTKTALETISRGTAQQNLSPVETLQLDFPFESDVASKVSNTLKPMFDKICQNNIENQRLSELRDSLLPKLMSGELDVSEIEI